MKKKHAKELTDAEAFRRLFPKEVREAVKKAAAKGQKKHKKKGHKHHDG